MPQPFFTETPPPAQQAGTGWQRLEETRTPEALVAGMAGEDGVVWLDSAVAGPGAVSLVTARPEGFLQGHVDEHWTQVEAALEKGRQAGSAGGLFGWVGFDGKFVLGMYPHALLYDHGRREWFDSGGLFPQIASSRPPSEHVAWAPLKFTPRVEREDFLRQVRRAQEYIAAGDIYQVNLSHPWRADWDPARPMWPLYERLRSVSPAPHAAFLRLAGTTVLSASPELFLKMDGEVITTRPIKGTRPRYPADPAKDASAAEELLACDKERAELLMITDLERNDLGQVCRYGSVHVPALWRVESFAQVYHLVSTVSGRLRPGMGHASAFKACFPGGSISGAPKKRALEIIAEQERFPRGLYTGAIGFFGYDGHSQWNIAIRTAIQRGPEITFHVGSGIVADSVPAREWEETLHKAAGLLAAWS